MNRNVVLVVLLFILMTLVMTYPLALHIGNALPGAPGDNFENLFRLRFFADAIRQGRIWPLTTSAIYYPFGYDLRYADMMPVNLATALPVVLAAGDVAGFNALLLASFVLAGLSAYLLARLLLRQEGPAIVAGILYAFSTYRVYRAGMGHLNHVASFLIPLVFLYVELALRKRKTRYGVMAGLFYALTGLATWNNAYVVALGLALYILARTWPWRSVLSDRRLWRAGAAFMLTAIAILGVPALLMLQAHQGAGLAFTLADADSFSGDIFALLAGNPAQTFASAQVLSPSYVPPIGWLSTFLVLIALSRRRSRFTGAFAVLLVASAILTWGLTLHWNGQRVYLPVSGGVERAVNAVIRTLSERLALFPQRIALLQEAGHIFVPLPAFILNLFLPLFSSLREWATFVVVMSPAVVVLASSALTGLRGRWRPALLVAVAFVSVVELAPVPFAYGYSETLVQPLVAWLQDHPDGGIVARFPLARWTNGATLYDGYVSGHSFIDGYAPYQPAGWRTSFPVVNGFPSAESVQMLRQWHVRYIVMSPAGYGSGWASVENALAAMPGLRQVATVPYLSRFRNARLTPPAPATTDSYVPVSEWLSQPPAAILDMLRVYELDPQ